MVSRLKYRHRLNAATSIDYFPGRGGYARSAAGSLKQVQFNSSISVAGAVLMGSLGFALTWFALRSGSRQPARVERRKFQRDIDRLFSDITAGLRSLAASGKFGGMSAMREKQVEVERMLSELQHRLRHLEDGVRDKYEARTHRILAHAARFGITLPPP